MEGGWGLDSGGVGIVFYRNGYFVVVEDVALSVKRTGLRQPISGHRGAVGSKQGQKQIRLYLYISLDKTYNLIYISVVG